MAAAAAGSRFLRDIRENFSMAVLKLGAAASGAAVCGALPLLAGPQPAEGTAERARAAASSAFLTVSFFSGVGTMAGAFWIGDAGTTLGRAKKVVILSLAAVPLAVSLGIVGPGCVQLAFSILGAPI